MASVVLLNIVSVDRVTSYSESWRICFLVMIIGLNEAMVHHLFKRLFVHWWGHGACCTSTDCLFFHKRVSPSIRGRSSMWLPIPMISSLLSMEGSETGGIPVFWDIRLCTWTEWEYVAYPRVPPESVTILWFLYVNKNILRYTTMGWKCLGGWGPKLNIPNGKRIDLERGCLTSFPHSP